MAADRAGQSGPHPAILTEARGAGAHGIALGQLTLTNRSRMSLWTDVKTVFAFLRARKLWWFAPLFLLLFALGVLLVLVEGSALAPFIYTLF